MSHGDVSIAVNEIIWQNVGGDVFQLFIEGAEGPEFLQLVRLSGLWQHKVDDHVAWREKWEKKPARLSHLLFCGRFKRIHSVNIFPTKVDAHPVVCVSSLDLHMRIALVPHEFILKGEKKSPFAV